MDKNQEIEIRSQGDAAIVSFLCSCISDVEAITQASSQIRQYVEGRSVRRLVFDFSGVKFFSSQVLGLLLEARGAVRDSGGDVAVCSLDVRLTRVFRITSLDKIFCFYPDVQAAIDVA